MAMLCHVKMTSRCIRPKTAVETEMISAGSFLKGRTRCIYRVFFFLGRAYRGCILRGKPQILQKGVSC